MIKAKHPRTERLADVWLCDFILEKSQLNRRLLTQN